MNRFTRLVELRSLKEETLGQSHLRAVAEVNRIKEAIAALGEMTREGEDEAREDMLHGSARLVPAMYDQFNRGQVHRRGQLDEALKKAEGAVLEARAAWQAAYREMKQAERLEETEGERLDKEARTRETRTLDELGSMRHFRKS